MMHNNAELKALLIKVYGRFHFKNTRNSASERADFVFHMIDWDDDLKKLFQLYRHPSKYSAKDAGRLIAGFLYHVIPHLNAAGRLLLGDVSDPFLKGGTHKKKRKSTKLSRTQALSSKQS
jgi:hypothetical protein